jgi:hypothetical protein
MISYASQTYTIEELSAKDNVIRLVSKPEQVREVIIRPSDKLVKLGTTQYTRFGNCCGWGGSDFGEGNEIGTKIELGRLPMRIRRLHVHLLEQAFDSSIFRLHIRSIKDNLPLDELLNTNIMLTISKESGWIDFDLSKYNIVLKGDVAVTLEWVRAYSNNKNRSRKINNKVSTQYVLFSSKTRQGLTFTRWGTEANWIMHQNESPSLYLTIQ